MRVLMLTRLNTSLKENSGILKKLNGQSAGYKYHGCQVDRLELDHQSITLNDEKISSIQYNIASSKRHKLNFFHFKFYQILLKRIDFSEYQLIHIRYHLTHKSFVRFINYISKIQHLKIILEFPTFPYELEYKGIAQKFRLIIDRSHRNHLCKYVNQVIHYGPHETIYDIPVINITNGLDTSIPYQESKPQNNNTIKLVAIGKWALWHGLDRIFDSIKNYKGKIGFILHVVGEGPMLHQYKEIVNNNDLNDSIIFHGNKTGKALDKILIDAHIGIGSLGVHRIAIRETSALKHREYCARKLPMVLAGNDKDFKDTTFTYNCTSDESAINFESILSFRKNISKNYIQEMDKHTTEHLSWYSRIETILKCVKAC